jgi:hypothetical protein
MCYTPLIFNDLTLTRRTGRQFGQRFALGYCVKKLNKITGETTMATEKKSLASKKATPTTKSKSKAKVETTKPAASKVVAAMGTTLHKY